MFVTNQIVARQVGNGKLKEWVDVPAGTRCVPSRTGTGQLFYFVDDLSWFPKDKEFFKHDAVHYGIMIEPDLVSETTTN